MLKEDICIRIDNLSVEYKDREKTVSILHDVYIEVKRGEIIGILGESGSGKTTLALALAGLLSDNAIVQYDSFIFNGRDITNISSLEKSKLHGKEIGFIFQDALSTLNPVLTIGYQLIEMILLSKKVTKYEAKNIAINLLQLMKINAAEKVMSMYPHELSGGMRQRVMIALATIYSPTLVIADEPTSSLDGLTEQAIIKFILKLKDRMGFSMIIISHDKKLLNQMCNRVIWIDHGTAKEITV